MRRLLVVALVVGGLVAAPLSVFAQDRSARIERARQLFQEGAAAYEAGRLREALQKMKAAQHQFRRPEFAFNIARVLERMGEAGHAISWFRVYLRHGNPTAEERADVNERIAALREFERRMETGVIAAPPSNDELTQESRTFFNNGVAMYRRGEYEAAMQAFQYAQQFAPFPELYYNMALTAEQLRSYRDAADYLELYLEGRPNAPGRAPVERKVRELRAAHRR
ncbi:MAG: hypothetical protein AAGF12_35385 [Myxococcota bacterium]